MNPKGYYTIAEMALPGLQSFSPSAGVAGEEAKAASRKSNYRAETGHDAPPWEPSRRRKYWLDPAVAAQIASGSITREFMVTYKIIEAGQLKPLVMTAGEAATVNLPGPTAWPAWNPKDFDGSFIGPDGMISGHGGKGVCTPADAAQLLQEIGGDTLVMDESLVQPSATEDRRPYEIRWRGKLINCAQLLAQKYQLGVGRPGSWKLDETEPRWIPAPETDFGIYDTRPLMPTPVRELAPTESIMSTQSAGMPVYIVVDSTVESQYNPKPAAAAVPAVDLDAKFAVLNAKFDALQKQVADLQGTASKALEIMLAVLRFTQGEGV